MRATSLLPLLLATPGFAAPGGFRIPASSNGLAAQAIDSASSWLHTVLAGARHQWDPVEEKPTIQAEKLDMHGIECKFDNRRSSSN